MCRAVLGTEATVVNKTGEVSGLMVLILAFVNELMCKEQGRR